MPVYTDIYASVLLSLALVLGLELSSRTNFESLALALALKVKSLALAKHVFGLAGLVICQTNNSLLLQC